MASAIGGLTYGVFKQASLLAVKVGDRGGASWLWQLLVGLEAVWSRASGEGVSAVVNLSLGFDDLEIANPLDEIIENVS